MTNVIGHVYDDIVHTNYKFLNSYKPMKDETMLLSKHLPKDTKNEPSGGVGG